MANTFLRKTERNIGTTLTQIDSYAVSASPVTKTTVIGLTCANTTTSSVDVDVALNDGTNDFYLLKSCPVPSGSTICLVGGDQKLVMEPLDKIKVKSTAASSVDVIMSILEIT